MTGSAPPNPSPTAWAVEPSAEKVELHDNTAEVTFTVKNQQATRQRVVFEFVPGDAVEPSWAAIDGERQRAVEANQSTQFKVTITAPAGTPVASYWFQARVYSADVAPEESSTLSNRVTFTVAQPTNVAKKAFPWWIVILAVAVVAVLAIGGYLLTRPKGPATIPAVTGKTEDQAKSALKKAGFDSVKVVRVQSPQATVGTALGTTPEGGTEADRGDTISLRIAISLAAPAQIAPGDNSQFKATTTKVSIAWKDVPDAARYRLRVTAPSCSVTPPTSAPPPTTAPQPTPPPTPPPMIKTDLSVGQEFFIDKKAVFDNVFKICALSINSTTNIDLDDTSVELGVNTGGNEALVQWSVSALDDQGNEGPSSPIRQFAYVS
jgi:hypothetical protein